MPRLKRVEIALPPWAEFERTVTDGLAVEDGESPEFKGGPAQLELPLVLWFDYDAAAKQVGWTLGQFLSFLILRGAISLMPEVPKNLTLEAEVDMQKFWKGDHSG